MAWKSRSGQCYYTCGYACCLIPNANAAEIQTEAKYVKKIPQTTKNKMKDGCWKITEIIILCVVGQALLQHLCKCPPAASPCNARLEKNPKHKNTWDFLCTGFCSRKHLFCIFLTFPVLAPALNSRMGQLPSVFWIFFYSLCSFLLTAFFYLHLSFALHFISLV